MGDGGPSRGPRLVSEVARRSLAKVWGTPSLEAAGLGQVHFQIGGEDMSPVKREMARRARSGRL